VELLSLLLLVLLALAGDAQLTVFHEHLDVLLLDVRQLGLDFERLRRLCDVDRGSPVEREEALLGLTPCPRRREGRAPKDAIQAFTHLFQFPKWIPTRDAHVPSPRLSADRLRALRSAAPGARSRPRGPARGGAGRPHPRRGPLVREAASFPSALPLRPGNSASEAARQRLQK